MDILTQGITGALVAQLGARPEYRRQATIAGFAGGLLPDADTLIRSSTDPLLSLEFHRQFSHSLLFNPVGALIATLILLPFMHKTLPAKRLYIFCLMGYSSAGILDACTSYGTQLLWPFSGERIAWNLIAIIDPVFTIGILIAVIVCWRNTHSRAARYGIGFAAMYLLLAFSQQQSAKQIQHTIANNRDHQIERSVIKPTLGNIILWRSIYQYDGQYYIDGIRPAFLGQSLLYKGDAIPAYHPDKRTKRFAENITQYQDILRFDKLSNGYLVVHPKDRNVLGDIRYAMLPNSIEPLWGIHLSPGKDKEHVTQALFRSHDAKTRERFISMLLGTQHELN